MNKNKSLLFLSFGVVFGMFLILACLLALGIIPITITKVFILLVLIIGLLIIASLF